MKRFIVRKVLQSRSIEQALINTPLPLHHHPLIYHKKILDVIGICVTQENIEYVISKIQSIFSISSFFYNPHGDELCNPTILQPSGSLYRFEQRPQGHLIFSAPYDIYIIYIYMSAWRTDRIICRRPLCKDQTETTIVQIVQFHREQTKTWRPPC